MLRPLFLLLCFALSLSAHGAGFITNLLNHPVPGGVAVVDLGDNDAAPQAFYQDKPVLVVRENKQHWIAIVGIPLKTAKGSQTLKVRDAFGSREASFEVGTRQYREQHITLKNKRQVNPLAEDLKRIDRELAEQNAAYATFTLRQPSNLLFDRPVTAPLSSPFGLRRFFNKEERAPHSGLDFAAAAGTPIQTPAAGRVILVGDYFFNGKTVFVDHGQGLISMFCHMSQIKVRVGDELKRHAVIGNVGQTGRATGPHLHWNVSLNGTRVDPTIFIGQFQP
ncbi:peptidoglycan DD-metalloendopeptidase family protein [Pokkaliibacter sp. MBI-7]|uniref:M23 family metallopeptidase n=1 Tax=Pokkaliibacter sp. MBI-7 TaxID=3040600 RepID=UPI00244B7D71|nr:M23 family metallopeptidase [Pokkaliibacter sp. MBI-7]MDH2433454.1 peptidoglycan DD-metalloendopeptidase family protein [Pokkaliibacter sp. MBI-7]